MNQKKMSLMLKGVTILLGMMGAVFFIIIMPVLADECKTGYSEATKLYWPGLVYGYVIGVIVYVALFNFWKICCEIGKDNSFSKENIKSLNNIGMLAILASCIWFLGIVFLIAIKTISIGFLCLMLLGVIGSIIVAIVAIALSHLVGKAYEITKENELTI